MEKFNKNIELIKIILAVALVCFGCVLLMCGFWVAPMGIIDSSVLVGFGECLTFSGAILGINYIYSAKHKELEHKIQATLNKKFEENKDV